MASLKEISKKLHEFGIVGCHVRSRNIIAFSAQKWEEDDAMVPRETMLFFYYPDEEKAEQWAASEWDLMTGVLGCACFAPQEQWVFVSEPGEVYVVGQGDDGDEKPITRKRAAQFSAVKCIAGGYAYAAGSLREVYKRSAANKWLRVGADSLSKQKDFAAVHAGFRDIDGYSESDLYACGGRGDLWRFDGKRWLHQDCPTDANLEKIVCAPNGTVYVTTNQAMLVVGRADQWRTADIDIHGQMLQEIVCYGESVLVSTDDSVFDVTEGFAKPVAFGLPKMTLYTHLAAGDGILALAGQREAFVYDGSKWKKVFQL